MTAGQGQQLRRQRQQYPHQDSGIPKGMIRIRTKARATSFTYTNNRKNKKNSCYSLSKRRKRSNKLLFLSYLTPRKSYPVLSTSILFSFFRQRIFSIQRDFERLQRNKEHGSANRQNPAFIWQRRADGGFTQKFH